MIPKTKAQLAKRRSNMTSTVALSVNTQSIRIPIRVSDGGITIIVTSIRELIPPIDVAAGLSEALRSLQPIAMADPHMPISNNGYWYRNRVSNIWIHVQPAFYNSYTWEQLKWTLAGLLYWMKGDHCRELAFEVNTDARGYVAFGSVGHDVLPANTS